RRATGRPGKEITWSGLLDHHELNGWARLDRGNDHVVSGPALDLQLVRFGRAKLVPPAPRKSAAARSIGRRLLELAGNGTATKAVARNDAVKILRHKSYPLIWERGS